MAFDLKNLSPFTQRRPIPSLSSSGIFSPTRTTSSLASFDNVSFSDVFALGQDQDTLLNREDHIFISDRITWKWKQLLRNLLPSDSDYDVENIIEELEDERETKRLSIQDVSFRALQEWERRKASQAHYSHLLTALEKVGRTDLKEELERRRYQRAFTSNSHQNSHSSSRSSFCNVGTPFMPYGDYHQVGTSLRFFADDIRPGSEYTHQDQYDEAEDELDFMSDTTTSPHKKCVPEVEALKLHLNNPSCHLISIAGPINSGKTTIIDNVYRQVKQGINSGFENTKVLRIQGTPHKDANWLTSKIVEIILKQVQTQKDQSDQAIKVLKGIIETDAYTDILLILDISLIPYSKIGKNIIGFLHKLMQVKELFSKITIVLSALWSLEDSKLFKRHKGRVNEIVVEAMSYEASVEFIRGINSKLPKKIVGKICKSIECFPFFLKYIAEMNLERFLCVEGKYELLKSLDCHFDIIIEDIYTNLENKDAIQTIIDCFDSEQKEILAQLLSFCSEFDVKQGRKICRPKRLLNCNLNSFCRDGALFLESKKLNKNNNLLYKIPTMTRKLLKTEMMKDEKLKEKFLRAELNHQKLYLNLLLHMSTCFLGETPSRNKELAVLEPFSSTNGISEKLTLATNELNARPLRIVKLFESYREDFKACLQVFESNDQAYDRAVSHATDLRVFYLLTKLLDFHEIYYLYQGLYSMSEDYCDLDTQKLRVFLAAIQIYSFNYKNLPTETKSLLDAAQDPLFAAMKDEKLMLSTRDPYILCLFCQALCSMIEEVSTTQNASELCCKSFKDIYDKASIQDNQKISYEAFLTYSLQRQAVYLIDMGYHNEAKKIVVEECLPFCTKYLGDSHPITLECKKAIGMTYSRQQNYDQARKSLLEVLDAEQELLGDHGDIHQTLKELGLCNWEMFNAQFHSMFKPISTPNIQSGTAESTLKAKQTLQLESQELSTTYIRSSSGFSISTLTTEVTFYNDEMTGEVDVYKTSQLTNASFETGTVLDTAQCSKEHDLHVGEENLPATSELNLEAHAPSNIDCANDSNKDMGNSNLHPNITRDVSSDMEEDQRIPVGMEETLTDLANETEKYLKLASFHYGYKIGRCNDAHKCMKNLGELYKLLGSGEKSFKWLAKALKFYHE